jgi:hypothetical protein
MIDEAYGKVAMKNEEVKRGDDPCSGPQPRMYTKQRTVSQSSIVIKMR